MPRINAESIESKNIQITIKIKENRTYVKYNNGVIELDVDYQFLLKVINKIKRKNTKIKDAVEYNNNSLWISYGKVELLLKNPVEILKQPDFKEIKKSYKEYCKTTRIKSYNKSSRMILSALTTTGVVVIGASLFFMSDNDALSQTNSYEIQIEDLNSSKINDNEDLLKGESKHIKIESLEDFVVDNEVIKETETDYLATQESYVNIYDLNGFYEKMDELAITSSKKDKNFNYQGDSDVKQFVVENYSAYANEIAPIYGHSSDGILSLIAQESGKNDIKSKTAIGITQIYKNTWANQTIKAFNHELGQTEYVFISNSMKIYNEKTGEGTKENPEIITFGDLEKKHDKAIKVCSMILQNCMEKSKDSEGRVNLIKGLLFYHLGDGNIKKIEKSYGQPIDSDNVAFLEARDAAATGDYFYLVHVFRYLEQPSFFYKDIDGIYHYAELNVERLTKGMSK